MSIRSDGSLRGKHFLGTDDPNINNKGSKNMANFLSETGSKRTFTNAYDFGRYFE